MSERMTPTTPPERELVALLELSEKATPGEFLVVGPSIYALKHHSWKRGVEQFHNATYASFMGDNPQNDAAFIAALVNWFRSTRAATVPQGEWLPIESAPKDGTAVLGFWFGSRGTIGIVNGTNYGITAFNPDRGEWYDASESDNEDDVWGGPSRWQPLPTPPPAELGEGVNRESSRQ